MSLEKYGVIVGCENCNCGTRDGQDSFLVTVPVSDSKCHTVGRATLRCTVSSEHHQVELLCWEDDSHVSINAPEGTSERLSAALAFVADHRICGNQHLCPSEVVRIVATLEDRHQDQASGIGKASA